MSHSHAKYSRNPLLVILPWRYGVKYQSQVDIYDQTLGREYVGMNDQTSRVEVRGHQKKENRKSIFSQFTLLVVLLIHVLILYELVVLARVGSSK